jgi:hypothetical protein
MIAAAKKPRKPAQSKRTASLRLSEGSHIVLSLKLDESSDAAYLQDLLAAIKTVRYWCGELQKLADVRSQEVDGDGGH